MGMYKSHLSPEQEKARSNRESVESFLARGGQIQRVSGINNTQPKVKAKSGKIDAQKLLDAAIEAGQEKEMIEFLKSQGIEVQ
jgi:hypothetical protein